MTANEYRQYLQSVRQAAKDAQRARDALTLADHNLTRVSHAATDATHVSFGGVNYDATAGRIHRYQCARESATRRLHDSLETLRAFRSELSVAPLYDRECNALWLRHVHGASYAKIGKELSVSSATAFRYVRDAETVLAESLGVEPAEAMRAPTGG